MQHFIIPNRGIEAFLSLEMSYETKAFHIQS
jgi:hypothetical protein